MVFHNHYVKNIPAYQCLYPAGKCILRFSHIKFLFIEIIIFLFLFSGYTTAQTNPQKSDKNKKDEYHQIYEKAKFYQNRADSTLKIIRILRNELSTETNTEEKALLEKKILNLEQQQTEYQKYADQYFEKTRALKNNIDLTDQQERLAEISVYSDAFYKLPAVSSILTPAEWKELYSLEPFYSDGNSMMQEIAMLKKEKNQLEILTNTSQDRGENETLKSQIENLNLKIRNMENKAFLSFQKVYTGKYKINSGIINRITLDTKKGNQKIILNYKNNAARSYKKSFELLKEAESTANKEKQFDLLGESNTYALLAVETQKKAIGTYSGIFSVINSASSGPSQMDKKPVVSIVREEKQTPQTNTPVQTNQFMVTTSENTGNYTIPVDKPLPSGVIYKIQIGVYQKIPSKSFFKGIRPISAETIPSSQNLRFFAGIFSSYQDALPAVDTVHKLGFKDAFIISYLDQKKISVKEARKLENETVEEKNYRKVNEVSVPLVKKQPTDMYKNVFLAVQIGAFHNKVPEKRMSQIRLHSENEPVTFFQNKNGLYVYSIGKFYNFEKTVALKNRLIENGLEGAYVIALSGNQKIPLDEAIRVLSRK